MTSRTGLFGLNAPVGDKELAKFFGFGDPIVIQISYVVLLKIFKFLFLVKQVLFVDII